MFNPINVSSKFAICGLPLRLDTYKSCSFNCTYCFGNNRVIGKKVEDKCNVNWLSKKFEKVFDDKNIDPKNFLECLLNENITLHGGGQSDCFQPREKNEHITRDIVDICNEYDRHILFSTKSDTVYDVDINPELHSFQLSVSNMSNCMEKNVPAIKNRIKFFDDLKNDGFKVGIRIQPFIPEITDIMRIVDCFENADHFTIEGLKLVPQNIVKNKEILKEIGLVKEDFKQMGLLNLYPDVRLWYYYPVIEYFEEHGITYSIADNDLHYLSSDFCCCGDNLIDKQTTFHNTYMLKTYGEKYSIEKVLAELDDLKNCVCKGLFTSNRQNGCVTVEDFYQDRFNRKSSPFSPLFNYYEDTQQSKLI